MRFSRHWLVLVLLLGIGLCWGIPVYAATDPLLMSPDLAGGGAQYPLGNYQWDANGFWDRFNGVYLFANLLMEFNAFLVRLGIWVMGMGYAPSNWLAPFQAIANVVSKNHFLDHIWPFFALIAGAVLIKDLAQHHIQRMMQRAMLVAVALSAVLLFNAIGGTVKYIQMVTEAMDALCYGASGWILDLDKPPENTAINDIDMVGNPDRARSEQAISKVNQEIWQQLIVQPWELGEPGKINATLGKDADAVRDITGQNVNEGTLWRDVLLQFPVGDKKRDQLAAILNNDDHPDAKQAFAAGYRFVLALADLLAVLCADLFLLAVGVVLNFFYLLYLASMLSGVVLLPVSILPWEYSHSILRWWVKALGGSVIIRIGLSVYVGLTFFVERVITAGMSGMSGMASMLMYPAVLVLALLVLSRIYKRFQPVQRVTGNVFSFLGRKSQGRQAETEEAASEQGGNAAPKSSGSKKGGAGSGPRRVDPDRGIGTNTLPKWVPKPVSDWARGTGRTLRQAGEELRTGDSAGAAYVIATDTARGMAEGAWKTAKWGVKTGRDTAKWGTEQGRKLYKWLASKIHDNDNTPSGGGGGDDNNNNNGGGGGGGNNKNGNNDSNNRSRRIDPDRMDWLPETRDPAYWESVFRDGPRRPRQEPPGPRTEEDWQDLFRHAPDGQGTNVANEGRSGGEVQNGETGANRDADTRAENRRSRPAVPRTNERMETVPEMATRPVNPDSGTHQPMETATRRESPQPLEQPPRNEVSDWQRWTEQSARQEREAADGQTVSRPADAPALRRTVETRVETVANEPMEENVQRTNPDDMRGMEASAEGEQEPRPEMRTESTSNAQVTSTEAARWHSRAQDTERASSLEPVERRDVTIDSSSEPESRASRPVLSRSGRFPEMLETRQSERSETNTNRPSRATSRRTPPRLRDREQNMGETVEQEESRRTNSDTPPNIGN